ncbi:MAG: electron transport complex subunit RsxE [Gammaproteobacteria bacterium]|nr:electron transport complex subunit RsxE [Gammaproteobacteria bacterium]|tara:strand:- start:1561 stop:2229 length:669 start_codon:yes stop_codon:yes gene_type:complete
MTRWHEGLWSSNPALAQLLGLCPLLAVSTTLVSGAVLGAATLLCMTFSCLAVASVKRWIPNDARLPAFVIVIATMVTLVDLSLMTFAYALHQTIGLFIPLIVTNCAVLARVETAAYRRPVLEATRDGLAMGAGFAWVLIVLGGLREMLGRATLFSDWHVLAGGAPLTWQLPWFQADGSGLLLALLPPGAFFGLALLLVIWRWLSWRGAADPAARSQTQAIER